ncbi:hypothetical protein HPP92_012551 [Vanilla planifolia]|uniref:Uncharacterized protein n=1 Tax=Vanilla planifolia TaxID=51239 RepID=A0A835R154_VANPL|nr:hypothetical protein HPP92_012551 [Vanilla planifolia]
MAAETRSSMEIDEALKPFYERASEAEERLARLEALFSNQKGHSNTDSKKMSSVIKDFQSKLEIAQAEIVSEQEKASNEIQKLVEENLKLRYRISHLLRAVKEAYARSNANKVHGELP